MNQDDFVAKFKHSLRPGKIMVTLILDAPQALVLISTMQLALRHPQMPDSIPPIAKEIVDAVIQAFPKHMQAELRKGYDEHSDVVP